MLCILTPYTHILIPKRNVHSHTLHTYLETLNTCIFSHPTHLRVDAVGIFICARQCDMESFEVHGLACCCNRYTTHCNTLQHTTTHCYTLQHTATHCNTLQHMDNAIWSRLKCTAWLAAATATQHTATHYNALQPTAKHCNTL